MTHPGATPRERTTGETIDAFRRIFRALRMADQQTRSTAGLSAAQLFVLSRVAEAAAPSLTELAASTHTDRSSAAEVVERLEGAGLVERGRSEADRRRREVRITPAGRAVLEEAPSSPASLLLAALERLDGPALDGLAAGLRRLVREMGLDAGSAPMLFEDAPAARRPRERRDDD